MGDNEPKAPGGNVDTDAGGEGGRISPHVGPRGSESSRGEELKRREEESHVGSSPSARIQESKVERIRRR